MWSIYMCVCECVCVWVGMRVCDFTTFYWDNNLRTYKQCVQFLYNISICF